MQMNVFFSESEINFSDFDSSLKLLRYLLDDYIENTSFSKLKVKIFVGVPDETQKEKACDKGIRQQRWNKTVNASKSS